MQCQKTIDARKFSHQALEEMRVSAVARVEAGESPERVAEGLGINRRTIYRWLSACHYGGMEAIKAKPIPGAPAKVNAKQMAQLSRIIREKIPSRDQLPAARNQERTTDRPIPWLRPLGLGTGVIRWRMTLKKMTSLMYNAINAIGYDT